MISYSNTFKKYALVFNCYYYSDDLKDRMAYATLDSRYKRHSNDRYGSGFSSLKRAVSSNSLGRSSSLNRSNSIIRAATAFQNRDSTAVKDKANQLQLHVKISEKKLEVSS